MSTLFSVTFLGYLVGSVAMGMSCGTGCSPAISVFLSSYVFEAEGDTRKSFRAFVRFFLGKGSAVVAVCLAASAIGSALITEDGYFGKYQLKYLMPAFLILTGFYMLHKTWKDYHSEGDCGSCHSCGHTDTNRLMKHTPYVGGFLYGVTPCAPLIILAGYAVTMPTAQALILGIVFSIACIISPLLLIMVLMKLIVVNMQKEQPKLLNAMKIVMSGAVLVMGVVTVFTGIEPAIY